jgi:DNA-binding NarL/FixJ family response regulator
MSLIKNDLPEVKFVFHTNHVDPGYLTEAMRLGASGYVLNNSGSSELLATIEEVLEGHCQVA